MADGVKNEGRERSADKRHDYDGYFEYVSCGRKVEIYVSEDLLVAWEGKNKRTSMQRMRTEQVYGCIKSAIT